MLRELETPATVESDNNRANGRGWVLGSTLVNGARLGLLGDEESSLEAVVGMGFWRFGYKWSALKGVEARGSEGS